MDNRRLIDLQQRAREQVAAADPKAVAEARARIQAAKAASAASAASAKQDEPALQCSTTSRVWHCANTKECIK